MSFPGYSSDSDSEPLDLGRVAPAPIVETRTVALKSQPAKKRTFTGNIETEVMDALQFERNKRLYQSQQHHSKATKAQLQQIKKKRKSKGDPAELDGENQYKGPWASYSESEDDVSDHQSDIESEENAQSSESEDDTHEETTTFHGDSELDYLGRTYLHVPNDVDTNLRKEPGSQRCYVPKKKIHTYAGHAKGTQCIQFFPNSGHLLLSSGNDSAIKLWDVYHKRKLLRGFYGHMKPVKCVDFNSVGTQFLSCSYDETVKLWNTETGQCLFRKKLSGIPNVVKHNPNDDNEFLVGLSNKKIEHYDIRTTEIIQTYEHHTDAISSLEFINNGEQFVSSANDKSLRIWDIKVNMPIRLMADPKQFSMPFLKTHPRGEAFAAQSSNNMIQTFTTSVEDKFKRNRDRSFTGHNSANYSIGLSFTPDGRNIMSGDSHGFAFFWEWRSAELISKLKVSTKPITCIDAHPQETSMVGLGGLDGKIYLIWALASSDGNGNSIFLSSLPDLSKAGSNVSTLLVAASTLTLSSESKPSNWLSNSNMVLCTSLSPDLSESNLFVPMASNSSIKMMVGAFSLASSKASRTSLAPSPMNICTN